MQKSRDRPLPLVTVGQDQRYVVGPEALEMISSLNGKVAVVSVAGLYRTGKSYLLNRMLLNRNDGFGVGSTIEACTKGIWVWGRPLVQKINEEFVNVLIVDSEGLGSLCEDSNHDSKIFALTLLISSLFIYNSIGSIDENTLAGLGLTVNLSKHLRSRAGGQEGDDCGQFPSLFWVVRDFSLQLVDKEGEEISQKEYLENSLALESPSSANEGRNEIRKAILKFFKDRHCVTLVRPSTNEEDLQHLDKMDLDSLKPEFVEQVLNFRKAVMTSLTPKTLRGKPLTGITFSQMLCSFTQSINLGGIPTIETTWKYICQQECLRAFQEVMECFDNEIHQEIKLKIPMSKNNFVKQADQIKLKAETLFLKILGENQEAETQLGELRQRMESKIQLLRSDNRIENVKAAQEFVSGEFETIERKIRSGDYKKIGELVKEVQLFQEYYRKKCPFQQTKAQLSISEFLFRKLCEGVLTISKAAAQHEFEALKVKAKEVESRCQEEMETFKDKVSKEKIDLVEKVALADKVREQLQYKVDHLGEELEKYRNSLEETSKQKETLEIAHKRENNKSVNDLRALVSKLEKELDESKQEKNERLSSSDREILLLQHKIDYFEKSNQELLAKNKDFENSSKQQKNEHQKTVKDLENRYQTSKNALNCKVRNLDSLLQERINQLAMSEAQKCVLESRIQDLQQRAKNIKDQAEQNMRLTKQEAIFQKESQLETLHREMTNTSFESTSKIRKLESQLIEKESFLKQAKLEFQKTLALLQQKVEFLKTESSQKDDNINKLNTEYLQLMLMVECKDDEISQLQRDLKDNDEETSKQNLAMHLELNHLKENLASKHQKTQELSHQIETISESLKTSTLENHSLKEDVLKLTEQLKSSESGRKQVMVEQEIRLQQEVKRLLAEFETEKQEEKVRVGDLLRGNEKALVQLKNFYEMEKERNEKRFLEQTQKVSILEGETLPTLREQLAKVARSSEEEILRLSQEKEETTNKLRESEERLEKTLNKSQGMFDQELLEKSSTIDHLEKKELLIREELRKVQREFEEEKVVFLRKVENITFEMSRKEKEILQLNAKRESHQQALLKKDQVLAELRKESEQEVTLAGQRIDELKAKLQQLKDEHMELKIESEKELALARQKNEFLTAKVAELVRERELLSSKNLIDKPSLDKNDVLREQCEKSQQETASLEVKLEKARKALREGEANLSKQVSQVEKEKAQLQERLSSSEDKLRELNSRLSNRTQQYTKDLQDQRERSTLDKSSLSSEFDRMREELQRKGNEVSELDSRLQRETSLLEEKIRFVEGQRDQLKKEIEEGRKKLDFMMAQLQKGRKPEDEEDIRRQTQAQKKYLSQIEVLKESLSRRTIEAQQLQTRYKSQLKQLRDRNSQLQDRVMKSQKQLKINELLTEENEKLKRQRDELFLSHKAQISKEGEENRRRVTELERKYRVVEKKNAQHSFTFEKEYAKWMMERDALGDKVAQLEERLKQRDGNSSLLEKKSADKYRTFTNFQMMRSLPAFEKKP